MQTAMKLIFIRKINEVFDMRNREKQRENRRKKRLLIYENAICSKTDCMHCFDFHCRLLNSTDFKGKACPFFCTKEQSNLAKVAVTKKLIDDERFDLIDKYYGGVVHGNQ